MCFAPQRRALFQNRNFQRWSGAGVFCTFWLRATTACNFSSLIWPVGSAPAALASLLFDPPEPQIIGKTECFATFLPFRASASSFSLLWSDLFYSYLLSASSHLCFSSVHIVGSLTSKLPSINYIYTHTVCREHNAMLEVGTVGGWQPYFVRPSFVKFACTGASPRLAAFRSWSHSGGHTSSWYWIWIHVWEFLMFYLWGIKMNRNNRFKS